MHGIGIAVIAYNIPPKIEARFIKSIIDTDTRVEYCIEVIKNDDDCLLTVDNRRYMCRARGLNRGIIKLANKCDVIVCTDIDLIFPKKIFDEVYIRCINNDWVWGVCRNVDSRKIQPRAWDEWLKLPLRETGKGGFNAMTPEMWYHIGGWNEDLYGWGGEDDDMHNRALHKKLNRYKMTNYPIMHVNHPQRTRKRGTENLKIAKDMGKTRYTTNWLTGEQMEDIPFSGSE